FLINNAPPKNKGLDACTYQDFENAMRAGVIAPFYLTKLFDKYFADGAAIINISSTRALMSQPNTESYTAAKGAISALTHALAVTMAGRVRVNTISPGWIDTTNTIFSGADTSQHPVGRVGKPEDIAEMVLFLCCDKASFITGQDFVIDGGMTKQMIYHGDNGWKLDE
ncbi:MAG: SDR family oxidoreductase, partial [Firmicutes bacterium]|nr:SDR family oxidoreductase [Bacillota bacterium]